MDLDKLKLTKASIKGIGCISIILGILTSDLPLSSKLIFIGTFLLIIGVLGR